MTESAKKRSSVGKKILFIAGGLVVFLLITYFVVTSGAFIKGVILPRVSKSVGADITAADISFSPFSSIVLKKLKVQAPGEEMLVEADEVIARYKLMDIIGGNINVSEVTINSPTVTLVEDEKGKTNVDPLIKGEEKPATETKSEKPPQIDVRNVSLKNATVIKIKKNKDGTEERLELSNVNLSLDQLKNGASGKLDLAASIQMRAAADVLAASLSGKFDFTLAQNLMPENAKGATQFEVKNATGTFADLAQLTANLTCDLSPTEVKALALQFSQGGKNLGEVRASGPFDASKMEGKLKLEVASIDKQVLNLFGAAQGIDFGSTKINSGSDIELSQGGKKIVIDGQVTVNSFSITRTNQTSPTVDLKVVYNLAYDEIAQTALINTFTIDGQQNKRPLLQGSLSKPMKLDLGKGADGVDESAFDLTVTNLNLADWKAFASDLEPAGRAGLKVSVVSQGAGKLIKFDVASDVAGLEAKLGTNKLQNVDLQFKTIGQVNNLTNVNLEKCRVDLAHLGEKAAILTATGQYETESGNADLKPIIRVEVPTVLRFLNNPDMTASSGVLRFNGELKQKGSNQVITGSSSLSNLTAVIGTYRFNDFNNAFDLNVEKQGDVLQLKKVVASFNQGSNPGGTLEVAGRFDSKTEIGQFDLKLNQLNEHLFRPILQGSITNKEVVSILLNGTASATLNSTNSAAYKADMVVTNFVVRDRATAQAEAPLSVRLLADVAMAKQVIDLNQVKIGLSPTERAKNEIQLKGQMDMSQSNAVKGKLTLSSDSIDLTPFYDLYAAKGEAAAAEQSKTAAKPAPAAPDTNQEPEPANLGVKDLALDVTIGKFFLREIAIADLQVSTKIVGNKVAMKPVQLTLNGAPLKANVDLDLGVPGYAYDVSFSADRIPLEPIANSFVPEKRGQYKGDVLANVQVKGAGTTGVNLKKHLQGQVGLTYTNAEIHIVGKWTQRVLAPIAITLGIQDILKSPLNWVDSQINLGGGNIDITKAVVRSEAFHGKVTGVVPIADVLTNSPLNSLPVNLALRRSVAEKANLIPVDAPTNTPYVRLPDFVKLKGTLGAPEPDINKVALAGLLGRSVSGIIGGRAGDVLKGGGNVIENLGGLLQPKPAGTNTTTTNQPGTNIAPVIKGIQNLFKKK